MRPPLTTASGRFSPIRYITVSALFLSMILVQEEALTMLLNVQFTVLLILVVASFLPFEYLMPMVLAYVVLDNLIMGSFGSVYMVPQLIMWPLLALAGRLLRKQPLWVLVLVATVFAPIYGWAFIPVNMLVQGNSFHVWPYLLADLPAEGIMALTDFLTVLLLYKPLRKLLDALTEPSA